MGENAIRAMVDKAKHDVSPHTHSPVHPGSPPPPCPGHPCQPHMVVKGAATVMTNNKPAARSTDITEPCLDGTKCPIPVPGGPGIISKASTSVMIEKLPAARKGDKVAFASCVVPPIPSPTATLQGGSSDVKIG